MNLVSEESVQAKETPKCATLVSVRLALVL